MEDPNGNSHLEQSEESFVRRLGFGVLAACVLLWPALYNGYPTVFSDTGGYLLTGKFFLALAPFRAPGYAVFTKFASLGISAWPTVVAQAIMVVYVLRRTCDYLIDGDRKFASLWFLASVCVLAALTSLPWTVSLLMPDVFAGVLFLSAFLLAFDDDLRTRQQAALAAIFAISAAAHSSLLPIAALFVVAVLILRHLTRTPRSLSSASPALAWLLVPVLLAGFCTADLNRQMGLGFRLSPSKNLFLLARLFGDGLAADFLRENCPKRPFISCQYLSELPRTQEQFLFEHPLFDELIKGHQDEMGRIVRGTLLAYPLRFLKSSANETLLQLSALRTGDEIRSYGAREWNGEVIPRVFPADSQAFENAKQFRGHLTPLADASASVDTIAFWLSIATSLLLAGTGRFGRMNLFFYSALAYLLINASICATFAGVYDRYQGRVAWIMPFCLAAYSCCFARDWKRSEALPEIEELEAPAD